ncbi:MAG: hypothetical protein M3179_05915 [Actinomycetota bacterium]|nr:hypothetical protein [Actinomycetota bacterium]
MCATLFGACGSNESGGELDPTSPDVAAEFGELPQFPASEPLAARRAERGVVSRTFRAPETTPREVLEFYREALGGGWDLVGEFDQSGGRTYRGEWKNDRYRLRVRASAGAPIRSSADRSAKPASEYTLALHRI